MSTAPTQTLFERIGGEAAVDATVDAFYERVLADPELGPFFERVNLEAQHRQKKKFLTAAFGGPNEYRGREMAVAHAGLGITEHQFDLVAGHLVDTLTGLDVPQELIDEVVAIAGPLKEVIVEA